MTRIIFEQELRELHNRIKEMGKQIEYSYEKLFDAINRLDWVMVEEIKKNDRFINDMERQIEAQCLSIITRQQPIARDLRLVSAALKVVTDMERVGDHVVDMAELFLRLEHKNLNSYSDSLILMVDATQRLLHQSIDSFVKRNIEEAKQVIQDDDIIDNYFNVVKLDIVDKIKQENYSVDECIDVLMINKYLEKIGDHAVNIAQWDVFQETGAIDNIRLL